MSNLDDQLIRQTYVDSNFKMVYNGGIVKYELESNYTENDL